MNKLFFIAYGALLFSSCKKQMHVKQLSLNEKQIEKWVSVSYEYGENKSGDGYCVPFLLSNKINRSFTMKGTLNWHEKK